MLLKLGIRNSSIHSYSGSEILLDESNEPQRYLVKYFAKALVRRAYGHHSAHNYYFSLKLTNPIHHSWDLRFSVDNALIRKKRLNLIDFYIPHVHGSTYLFRGLRSFNSVRLKHHDGGRKRSVNPGFGAWNMINKKMGNGGTVIFGLV